MNTQARDNIVDGHTVEGGDIRLILQRAIRQNETWQARNRVQVEVINRMMAGRNTYDEVCEDLAQKVAEAAVVCEEQAEEIKRLRALKTPSRSPGRKW